MLVEVGKGSRDRDYEKFPPLSVIRADVVVLGVVVIGVVVLAFLFLSIAHRSSDGVLHAIGIGDVVGVVVAVMCDGIMHHTASHSRALLLSPAW